MFDRGLLFDMAVGAPQTHEEIRQTANQQAEKEDKRKYRHEGKADIVRHTESITHKRVASRNYARYY